MADLTRLAAALSDRYRIERELGAGGMATVYLAQDLKHDRKVAIKVLRAELAAVIGADRFLAEIKTTANLQHPHILPLFDSGEAGKQGSGGQTFLFYVMPYVEGESLRDRLNREKQLPITDAIRIATEVAGALDYAHRHSVIHRDIKPENILLHDGSALVADFGIALAASKAGSTRMTETGMSLGTPHYMSPEQAMGEREIGPQSDVYALGAVTYEMLVGEPPFTGPTAQSIVAKVLTEDPRPLAPKRRTIPPSAEAAVLMALEKLPADRFATAAEFSAALNGAAVTARTGTRMIPAPSGSRVRMPLIAAGIVAVALLLTAVMLSRRPAPALPLRASLMAPAGCDLGAVGTNNLVQVSPDGSMVAFVASCGSEPVLWVRSLVSGESRQLQGTGNASYPFWAPNSKSLGFFAETKLKRIDLETGVVQDLATVVGGRGGSWSTKDVVLYAPDIAGPLYQVSATGGIPAMVGAIPPDSQKIVTCRIPMFLPDGEHFLYSRGVAAGTANTGTVRLGKLGTLDDRMVLPFASNVAYTDGRLLFGRNGLLMAQPFDPASAKLSGQPVSIVPGLESWQFRFLENFSVSEDGRIL
ncbi:MAG: protein kinase, partial [Gemmatimonadota bacterium]